MKNGDKKSKKILLADFIDVKGWKANGNKLGGFTRLSGFKMFEAQIEDKIDHEIKLVEEVASEVLRQNDGDELKLF